jgi:hypothetical protein
LQWILDVFEMTTSRIELAKELVNRELLILWQYQVDVKNIKSLFQWL